MMAWVGRANERVFFAVLPGTNSARSNDDAVNLMFALAVPAAGDRTGVEDRLRRRVGCDAAAFGG